ncbi:MAG: SDR family oxidoreductase [Polyangiaceae bacterium]
MLRRLRAALGIDWFSFEDKVVLITGGSRGLGLALARCVGRTGARVVILARNPDELARAREDLRSRGVHITSHVCDVRDRAQVETVLRTVTEELGGIDVLINNAGTLVVGPMETMTLEDFEDSLRTNLMGALYTTMAVLPQMRKRGEGRIVNISSLGGKVAAPHLLPYTASKFALTGLSRGLRTELLQDNIVVTTVCPGLVRTGSPYNAFFKGRHRDEFTWFLLADSLPLLSMSARRAARKILWATRLGRAEVTLGVLAKIGAVLNGVLPGFGADLHAIVNAYLPEPDGIGTRRARGRDSQTRLSSSFLTILGQRAARDLNQLHESGQLGTARSSDLPGGASKSGAGQSGAGQSGMSQSGTDQSGTGQSGAGSEKQRGSSSTPKKPTR